MTKCITIPKIYIKKIWKKSRKSKNQKIKIPLVKKWHGWPIFLTHFWKLQDIPPFQDVCASMWEYTYVDLFYVKHCLFVGVSRMVKYIHIQITLVSKCVMKNFFLKKFEFLKSSFLGEYIAKCDIWGDYRLFSSLNIAIFSKKMSKIVKNHKIGQKRGQKCEFWGTHSGKYLW